MARSRDYSFTLNNYTDEDIEKMASIPCKYLIYGKEIGELNQTPHLQGYIYLKDAKTLSAMRKYFNKYLNHLRTSFRASLGSTLDNIRYCSKGEQSKEEYNELKDKGPNYGLNAQVTTYGKIPISNNDSETLNDIIRQEYNKGTPLRKIKLEYGTNLQRTKHIEIYYETLKEDNNIETFVKRHKDKTLTPTQLLIKSLLINQHERSILWVKDTFGNLGKTTLAKYLYSQNPEDTFLTTGGKSIDLCHAYKGQQLVIMDIPRSGQINYDFLEKLLNEFFTSGKYDSNTKTFKTPTILILTNNFIDTKAMSPDRYNILDIQHNNKLFKELTTKVTLIR